MAATARTIAQPSYAHIVAMAVIGAIVIVYVLIEVVVTGKFNWIVATMVGVSIIAEAGLGGYAVWMATPQV